MFDLLFRNARILDGAGNPWYRGDVGVRGEQIAAVGRIGEVEAARTVDCADRVLSPGFIDMHSHADVMLLAEPHHEAKIYQGVTTDVLGQDGLSYAPASPATLQLLRRQIAACNGNPPVGWDWTTVATFLERFERSVSVNVAFLVPHAAVRAEVLGMEDRLATPAELERMQALVDEGMADGAVGFATGLDYTPNIWSDTDELVALCSVVARRGGLYVTHLRSNRGDGILDPIREAVEIGRRSGVRVNVSHLRGDRLGRRVTPAEVLAVFEQARADGVDITYDSYPYTRGSSLVHRLVPDWAHVGGPDRLLERLRDRDDRRRIRDAVAELSTDWSQVTLAAVATERNRRLEGWSVAAAAAELGKDVADFLCDLLVEEDLAVSYISEPTSSEASIEQVLAHRLATSGSDGLCWGSARHPRTYGSFARVLGQYVRERRVMSLEEAVRKMTSACALRLGIRDRGLIREGMIADLAVWDDATIEAHSSYERPLERATGVSYVLVGGELVLDDGRHTGTTPGRALKPLLD